MPFAKSVVFEPQAEDQFRRGESLWLQGQFGEATRCYLAAVELAGSVSKYHCRAGVGLKQLGNYEQARWHLEQAVALDPLDPQPHEALSWLFSTLEDKNLALAHARRAAELAPGDHDAAVSLAFVLESDRQTDAAWEIARRELAAGRESARLAVLMGRIARHRQAESEALALIERLLRRRAFRHPREQVSLGLMAAHLLDRMGRYEEAFTHASHANAAAGVQYNAASVERSFNALINYFTRSKLRALPRATHGSRKPVFIVGMPRSGTTLVEQILASHPAVHGAGERIWMVRLAEQAGQLLSRHGEERPRCFDRFTPDLVEQMAAAYLQPLEALNPSARFILDKQLSNFAHLGLISLLFPDAKVIHCRRHPLDTCLSCYMTDFAAGNEFSFDLRSTGHAYRQYERLMAHWKQNLPLPILDVTYEQVVADVEGQARTLLKFLGLPWDERCLKFHETGRFVATASNAQVRRPIYTSSVNRWKNYERHLTPLRAALGWG